MHAPMPLTIRRWRGRWPEVRRRARRRSSIGGRRDPIGKGIEARGKSSLDLRADPLAGASGWYRARAQPGRKPLEGAGLSFVPYGAWRILMAALAADQRARCF